MIYLDDLIPTQNRLRRPVKPPTNDIFPISLAQTEDKKLYIWNGHHRLASLWDSGVRELEDDKFDIRKRTYKDLTSINFEIGFVTPFDPRWECRLSEFWSFKEIVMKYYERFGYNTALSYIVGCRLDYLERREIKKIEGLLRENIFGYSTANTG